MQTRSIVTPDQFRKACGRFATGVAVATTVSHDGQPQGLTVSSFTSVSLHPPLVLVCVDFAASAHAHFRAAKGFAINVLRDTQAGLSNHFAKSDGDRFEGVMWSQGVHGLPILDGALAAFECSMHELLPAGDHTIFVGLVEHVTSADGEPLLYHASRYRALL